MICLADFACAAIASNPSIDVAPRPNGPDLWDAILNELPGGAIVAGGAVRDYLLGIEPKDIDIFIDVESFVNPRGFGTLGSSEKSAEYEAMNEIAVVTRGEIAGYQIDLVGVTFDAQEMVDRFDFGVARCWYDGELHDTPEAAADRANKTVTLLLTDRLERSRARFARFNERMGGGWTLIEGESACSKF